MQFADRVAEASTSTGTGTFSLDGALVGFRSFSVGFASDARVYYGIIKSDTGEWEIGVGTFLFASATLTRSLVLASSNAGNLVDFPAGDKIVYVTSPAETTASLRSRETGEATLTLQAIVGQTARMIEVKTSGGTTLLDVGPNAYINWPTASRIEADGQINSIGANGTIVLDRPGFGSMRLNNRDATYRMPGIFNFKADRDDVPILSLVAPVSGHNSDFLRIVTGQGGTAFAIETNANMAFYQRFNSIRFGAVHVTSDFFDIDGMIGSAGLARLRFSRNTTGGAPNQTMETQWYLNGQPTVVAEVTRTGNVQGTGSYTNLSDVREKHGIADLDEAECLRILAGVRARRFFRGVEAVPGEREEWGFVAQEMQPVFPQAVVRFGNPEKQDAEPRLGVQETMLIPVLVAGYAALQRRLTAVEALQGRSA